MDLLGYTVHRPVVSTILSAAPFQSLPVQVGNMVKYPAGEKVVFHKSHQALYLALGEGMAGFAELSLKTKVFHKGLVVLLPDRMALQIPVQHNAFNIVSQDDSGHPHVLKGMDHPNEQVFLLGVREKLSVVLATVVAGHSEACCTICVSVVVQHICETPVHLVGLARRCGVTAPSVSLGSTLLPFGRDKVLMSSDIFFYNGRPSVKTGLLQTF